MYFKLEMWMCLVIANIYFAVDKFETGGLWLILIFIILGANIFMEYMNTRWYKEREEIEDDQEDS